MSADGLVDGEERRPEEAARAEAGDVVLRVDEDLVLDELLLRQGRRGGSGRPPPGTGRGPPRPRRGRGYGPPRRSSARCPGRTASPVPAAGLDDGGGVLRRVVVGDGDEVQPGGPGPFDDGARRHGQLAARARGRCGCGGRPGGAGAPSTPLDAQPVEPAGELERARAGCRGRGPSPVPPAARVSAAGSRPLTRTIAARSLRTATATMFGWTCMVTQRSSLRPWPMTSLRRSLAYPPRTGRSSGGTRREDLEIQACRQVGRVSSLLLLPLL